jgi:acyl-CoA synthetase (AMP-forming)/AMP-acid ligase II
MFLDHGCKKGDRVAILAENSHKFLEVYFGAAKAGVAVVPLNFRLAQQELTQVLADSRPVLLLVGDGYEELGLPLVAAVPSLETVVALDAPTEGCLFYEDWIQNGSDEDPQVAVHEDEMAVLMYTGGTTGLPKGVMLSHRNILASTIGIALSLQLSRRDTTCMLLPLFHASFWPALACLMLGGKVVVVRSPTLEAILGAVQKEKCTHINAVPTLYNWVLNYPDLDDYDLSSLRLMTYAGSPMPVQVLKGCLERFGKILAQGYGSTEAAPLISFLDAEDHFLEGPKSRLLYSAGKEGPGVEVRVMDQDGISLPAGEIGEITAKGANIMLGYWGQEDLTKERIRDGWLHTGDMGYLDEEGYIFLVDRKADMIVTGGENVYPTEAEQVLYQHPAVHECAVASAPDEKWGERVQAVVVLKPESAPTEEELIAYCREHLAGYKCPKKIEFWEQLPKSAIGKVLRKDVKKVFWGGRARSIN